MEGPEEIQDPSDSENNPANYDNEPEQARPTKRRAGNLLDYFPPVSEKQDDASDGEPEARPAQLRPAYSVFRQAVNPAAPHADYYLLVSCITSLISALHCCFYFQAHT